jgi:nucleotide-binding universal stress UspA family protein
MTSWSSRPCNLSQVNVNRKGVTSMSTKPEGKAASAGSNPRIVVGVDGSESASMALDWAAAEADRTGAVLEIQTAYEPGYVHVTKDEIQRRMDVLVEEAAARVAKLTPGVTTISGTHERTPAKALIEASDGADLLVVGSRGLGGFKGLLLGSVSQQCSHHARCPVTIVRAKAKQ